MGVLWCQRGEELQVREVQSGSWNSRGDKEGTNCFMAWEGVRSEPRVSPVRRISRRA